jgi:Sec-independent protein translocase protein TatA
VFGMGFGEVATLLLVALVVFGPKELPRYSRKAGQLVGRVHDWVRDIEDDRGLVASALAALAIMTIYLIGLAIHTR